MPDDGTGSGVAVEGAEPDPVDDGPEAGLTLAWLPGWATTEFAEELRAVVVLGVADELQAESDTARPNAAAEAVSRVIPRILLIMVSPSFRPFEVAPNCGGPRVVLSAAVQSILLTP